VVADQPLGPGVQGVHDAACDTFALAAASIGDHIGKESLFPWALTLRLSALMIKLAEIVSFAEEELRKAQESSAEVNFEAGPEQPPAPRHVERDARGNITSVVESRSSHGGQPRGNSRAAQDPVRAARDIRVHKAGS
jgi:hypothetical protein